MTTLTKIIVATILSLSFFSCSFNSVEGNGHVVEDSRTMDASFHTIKISEGLHVYVTQSDTETVLVEADENLQDLIITEVVGHVLKIHTKKNIGKATSKKIMVHVKNVSHIVSSSGSHVYSTNTITAQNLELKSSSGSHITLDLNAPALKCSASSGSNITLQMNTKVAECHSSSGSNIKLTGETIQLIAEASSGSTIKAGDLITDSSRVNASSGSNITVNTSKELIAKATSGAGIYYSGNPEKVEKNNAVSGSIKKR